MGLVAIQGTGYLEARRVPCQARLIMATRKLVCPIMPGTPPGQRCTSTVLENHGSTCSVNDNKRLILQAGLNRSYNAVVHS